MIVGQGQKDIPGGATFIAEKGRIFVTRGKITSDPKETLELSLGENDVRLYKSADHHRNFRDCIRSRELPICEVEIGHRSATVCHLSNLVARIGRKIIGDPVRETIVGDSEAAAMLSRPYRIPWTLA